MFGESNPGMYQEVLERLLTGIYVVDPSRRIVFWNDGAEKITGYRRPEVLGRFCRDNLLEHCDNKGRQLCHCECPLAALMQDGQPRESRMYLKHRDGRRIPVLVRTVALRDSGGTILGAAESFDVQILTPTVEELKSSPSDQLDDLTGLPNSWFVLSYLLQRTARAGKEFRPFTLLRLSVAHYPDLLRRYGATALAGLLRNLARSLRNALKPSDILARWGDSQFLVILEFHEEDLLSKVRDRLKNVVGSTSLDWWGDSIVLKVGMDERTVDRSEEKQSVLSWLGPVPEAAPAILRAAVRTRHCGGEGEE